MQTGVRVIGVVVFVAGLVVLLLAPLLGSAVFDRLWSVEPLSYIGAVVLLIGLGITSLSFFVPIAIAKYRGVDANGDSIAERWGSATCVLYRDARVWAQLMLLPFARRP